MITPLAKRWRHGRRGADNGGLDLKEAERAAPRVPQSAARSFRQGFSLQASNPKNLAFFVAILPQFILPEGNIAVQMVVFGVVSVLLELPILVIYGLASALSAQIMREQVIERIEAIGGGILIGLGGALASSERAT